MELWKRFKKKTTSQLLSPANRLQM